MPKEFPRSRRMQEQIQRLLSDALRGHVRDPRLHNVIVTDVRLSRDLSVARVYYATLDPSGPPAAELAAGLEAASGYLRSLLAGEIRARHVPELRFEPDETLARARVLDELIAGAVREDAARGPESDGEPPAGE
jgi:ribosome-binding factor A